MSFSIRTQKFSLTYPQCPVPRDEAMALIKEKVPSCRMLVAQEKHQTEGLHLHMAVLFDKRFMCGTNSFDIEYEGLYYHPNIQKVKDWKAWINYCLKEDESPLNELEAEKMNYGEIMSLATHKDEYLELVGRHHPRDLALNLERLSYFADWRYRPAPLPYAPVGIQPFKELDPVITDWLNTDFVSLLFLLNPHIGDPLLLICTC